MHHLGLDTASPQDKIFLRTYMLLAIFNRLLNLSPVKLFLATSTVLAATGSLPTPPQTFRKVAQYPLVQWFLVFVLAYQSGAVEDIVSAIVATILTYLLYSFVRYLEDRITSSESEPGDYGL